jgi:hypothetical protein
MRNDKRLFTKVTVETQLPDDNTPHVYIVEVPNWDCNVDDMLDMFKSILLAMGYHPDNLKMFDDENAGGPIEMEDDPHYYDRSDR